MINVNKFNVNILSFFISLIIFLFLISFINSPKLSNKNNLNIIENNNTTLNVAKNETVKETEIKKWSIEIKSLGINANINQIEGSIPNDDYVGHFKSTDILGKNIALIAFNFGSKNNYFANLKELKIGDEVIYTVNDKVKKFKVVYNQIIEEESLKNVLEEHNNNTCLKLFTYVKDLNNKLRYVYTEEIIDI